MGTVNGQAAFTWKREAASLRLTVLPEAGTDTEYATAMGWANMAYRKARQEAPLVMVRGKGKNRTFVTVFEPFKGEAPTITGITREKVKDGVGLKISKAGSILHFLVNFSGTEKTCGPIRTKERCYAERTPK